MQKSFNPEEGISGGLFGAKFACSNRQIQSPADPATFESYVELMRQGAAGSARVAAAARVLQREAHRTSLTAKAAMGALYKAGEDPFRLINIQFNPKFGRVESEGDRVAISIANRKKFRGEYAGDGSEIKQTAEELMAEKKQDVKKKGSRLKGIKEKIKNAARKVKEKAIKHKKSLAIAGAVVAAAGTASAINQAAQSSIFPELGPGCDAAALSSALVATNTRAALVQHAAGSFISAKAPVASRPARYRDLDRWRDFL